MIKDTTIQQDKSLTQVLGCSPRVIDAYDAIEWVRKNFNPEDIFSNDDLDNWAHERGYIWPSECDQEATP